MEDNKVKLETEVVVEIKIAEFKTENINITKYEISNQNTRS